MKINSKELIVHPNLNDENICRGDIDLQLQAHDLWWSLKKYISNKWVRGIFELGTANRICGQLKKRVKIFIPMKSFWKVSSEKIKVSSVVQSY